MEMFVYPELRHAAVSVFASSCDAEVAGRKSFIAEERDVLCGAGRALALAGKRYEFDLAMEHAHALTGVDAIGAERARKTDRRFSDDFVAGADHAAFGREYNVTR